MLHILWTEFGVAQKIVFSEENDTVLSKATRQYLLKLRITKKIKERNT